MFTTLSKTPKILVIDDDASQIVLLHKTLKTIGDVIFEQDGRAALDRVIDSSPDVILLDIDMPGKDGHEVLAELKANVLTQHIPVIFLTSRDSVDDQLKCLRDGAVDFIAKPPEPAVVAARVHTQLTLRSRERELAESYRHAKVTVESIGDAVITTDQNCIVTYLNPVAEVMIGLPSAEATGQMIEDIMPLRIGDDGPPHINPVRVAILDRRVVGMALNCQMMNQRGAWVPVEDSAAPLVSETGEILGAVIVFSDINESRALAAKMAQTVQYDQVTNLPNRFLLLELINTEITMSKRSGKKIGLLLVDINQFKLINSEFGFEYGDALLKKVAQRIKVLLRRGEILSRHHADQFMLLVPDLDRISDLNYLAESIKGDLTLLSQRQPELNGLSASFGLSIFPDDALDGQMLMMHADSAVHKAKKDADNGGVCFYSSEIESQSIARRHLHAQLKSAIENEDVIALFQPMIDPVSGEVLAVEALMRIRNQDGSFISPMDFIPLAEETGLIIELGERMVDLALQQLKHWADDGRRIRVCLNVSPVQFISPRFVPFLLEAIEQYGVSPEMIELEVTESLMMQNLDQVIGDMDRLRSRGISISIDDFGTGFSCLSYLKDLPVDVLKVDKAFVAQISADGSDYVLARTIVALAQSLGLQTVSEGVESAYQASQLRGLGVSLLQGFYFSPPVPADDLQTRYLI
ncbi:hypothetical protein MARI_13370 [Marinobacter sp. JH2]|nr:EAL domain-containing protein [Marinobacter sp. JH2]QBM17230.1 hypothetical protein MARI_13370 [Marinobacter sp. JH2]